MAFNHDQYWAEKIAKSARTEANRIESLPRIERFFSRLFTRSESAKHTMVGHRRSLKERLMRRLRHKSRVYNAHHS
jgi:hypothetical protein